ncbi:MAG: Gmad2 immunoglobulin-like domain-containing protein [Bacillota bacterium]
MRYRNRLVLLMTLLLLLSMTVGCKSAERPGADKPGADKPPGTASPKPPVNEPARPAKMPVAVYYLKTTPQEMYLVREVHFVPRTGSAPEAALRELVSGQPETKGAYRVLPPGTKILGIEIKNGLATVDFSREVLQANVGATGEALGIQSIVNTLTEFPEIKEVAFKVEGKLDEAARNWWGHVGLYGQPFTRHLFKVYEPAIWIYHPQPDQKVTSPLSVTGSARVFEGNVMVRLLTEDDRVLARNFGTATKNAPERGDFKIDLKFNSPGKGKGWVEAFSESPEDGSEMDKVRVPVTF